MFFKSIIGTTCTCLAFLSINANASVINTLNGVEYEWLELTATQGMSRDQVEAGIAAALPGDVLYGYEYASRTLVKDLLHSYSSWDGLDGIHGDSTVVTGMVMFLDDFGRTYNYEVYGTDITLTTVDGFTVTFVGYDAGYGFFGSSGECGAGGSCVANTHMDYDALGTYVDVYQGAATGWSDADMSTFELSPVPNFVSDPAYGSLLVRVSTVPTPAAAWLFGTGLIGLIGIARRKKV